MVIYIIFFICFPLTFTFFTGFLCFFFPYFWFSYIFHVFFRPKSWALFFSYSIVFFIAISFTFFSVFCLSFHFFFQLYFSRVFSLCNLRCFFMIPVFHRYFLSSVPDPYAVPLEKIIPVRLTCSFFSTNLFLSQPFFFLFLYNSFDSFFFYSLDISRVLSFIFFYVWFLFPSIHCLFMCFSFFLPAFVSYFLIPK